MSFLTAQPDLTVTTVAPQLPATWPVGEELRIEFQLVATLSSATIDYRYGGRNFTATVNGTMLALQDNNDGSCKHGSQRNFQCAHSYSTYAVAQIL
eukprot:COSAG02_NODE_3120_length_7329_cov_2.938866_3_plen_96_part_00